MIFKLIVLVALSFLLATTAEAQRVEIVWMAPLVEFSPNMWAPAIQEVRQGVTGSFPCVWKSSRLPDVWAVGLAEVDAAQLAALQADTRITVTLRSDATRNISTFTAPQKTRLATYTTAARIPAPRDTESLLELADRLAVSARGKGTTDMDDLLRREIKRYEQMREPG